MCVVYVKKLINWTVFIGMNHICIKKSKYEDIDRVFLTYLLNETLPDLAKWAWKKKIIVYSSCDHMFKSYIGQTFQTLGPLDGLSSG